MDRGGIEPPASSLRTMRSPKLSYRPGFVTYYFRATSKFSCESLVLTKEQCAKTVLFPKVKLYNKLSGCILIFSIAAVEDS